MTPNELTLATFQTRVRQMILRFQELKQENAELRATLAQKEQQISQLQEDVKQSQADYTALKAARMLEITDGDLQAAKDRLAKLIRDINKCIAVLTDENQAIN